MKTIYSTSCTATHEARNGAVRSDDGNLDVRLAMPKELGGPGGATNPEQLFAAGYAACFTSAMQRVARESKTDLGKPAVTVLSGLRSDGTDRFALIAEVQVALPDLDRDTALEMAQGAHRICPFSKAVGESLGVIVTLTDWQGAEAGNTLALEGA